jgi:hypothetical protein
MWPWDFNLNPLVPIRRVEEGSKAGARIQIGPIGLEMLMVLWFFFLYNLLKVSNLIVCSLNEMLFEHKNARRNQSKFFFILTLICWDKKTLEQQDVIIK